MKDKLKKLFNREEKDVSPEVKRKKMIVFFGFYLIFFIFLFIWLKNSNVENTNVPTDEETSFTYKTDLIENNNYTYVYEIEENENVNTIRGIRDDENYQLSEYKYKYFLDIYNIKKLIKNSKYLYKIDNNNEISYKYEIENKTISNLLQNSKEIENGVNNILVYVDNNDNVYKIELDLSSYMVSINEYTKYHLTLYYGIGE
jgi:hypothetical protein